MLIEQIIEFELRGLVPLGRICTRASGYFYDKTKIPKNLREDYFVLEYCLRQCTLLLLSGPNYLQNFTSKS